MWMLVGVNNRNHLDRQNLTISLQTAPWWSTRRRANYFVDRNCRLPYPHSPYRETASSLHRYMVAGGEITVASGWSCEELLSYCDRWKSVNKGITLITVSTNRFRRVPVVWSCSQTHCVCWTEGSRSFPLVSKITVDYGLVLPRTDFIPSLQIAWRSRAMANTSWRAVNRESSPSGDCSPSSSCTPTTWVR